MKNKKNIISEVTRRIIHEKYRTSILVEQIEYDPLHPERMHGDVERRLGSGEHTFGKNKGLPLDSLSYSKKLASERFKDIVNKVKRYHGVERITPQLGQQMMQIMQQISQIESRNKQALERLAVDIVSEEFDIPDEMLDAKLIPPGQKFSFDNEGEEEDEEEQPQLPKQPKSAKRMEQLGLEVDKRNIINAMLQGAAKKGHYVFHMVAEELDAIDPRLMGLYGKLMSLADFQYWTIPDSMAQGQGRQAGGMEKIEWRKNKPKNDSEDMEEAGLEDEEEIPVVVAQAWMFPVLVHELIKGTLELSASSWAEGHLDFEEQQEVIKQTDTYDNEIWGMRLGPGMWEKFMKCIPNEDYNLKQWLFRELSKLPAEKFMDFMKEILTGSERCKEVIQELKDLHNDDKQKGLEDILDDTGYDDMEDIVDNLIDDEDEGEEEGELSYENMSKSQIEDLIDDALEEGDFETVKMLRKYL
jgi:hypothetical protein